jgi:hypothetical protein
LTAASSEAGTVSAGLRAGRAFAPNAAVSYGRLVQAAYTMYNADPSNLTPPQSNDFPAGYQIAAWINMRDFIIGSTDPAFYGFIAHSMADANQFVLAWISTEASRPNGER